MSWSYIGGGNMTTNQEDTGLDFFEKGKNYSLRFQRLGKIEDLDKAIEYKTKGISLTAGIDPSRHDRLYSLRISCYLRFKRLGNLEDLHHAIDYNTRAIECTPAEHPDLPERLLSLGALYDTSYSRLGNMDNLNKAIEYKLEVKNLTPETHPELFQRLRSLALSYSKRFRRSRDLGDLDRAIEFRTRSVSLISDEHSDKPSLLCSLGSSHYDRYERLGGLGDLQKDIDYTTRAVELTSESDPDLSVRLSDLSAAYHARFTYLGDLKDIEKALEYDLRATSLTPTSHPDRPLRLSSLGVSYHTRFKRLRNLDDLEKATGYNQEALSLTSENDSCHLDLLSKLSAVYHERFVHFGGLENLDTSIRLELRAHSLTPDHDPDLATRLGSLGVSYHERFRHLGDLKDIDKAIELSLQAHSSTPGDHPSQPDYLCNLAQSYRARYERLGNIDDLDKTINYAMKAHSLSPENHSRLPRCLNILSAVYHERFIRLGNLGNLDQAIEYTTQSCKLTPEDHAELPTRLGSLGALYHDRFMHHNDPDDLANAIKFKLRSHELTPRGHPDQRRRLSNLGTSYYERFVRLAEFGDLEKSLGYALQAHALTPEEHLERPHSLRNLSNVYHMKFFHTGEATFLYQAAEYLRQASSCVGGHPQTRLNCALDWAALVPGHTVPPELDCLHAYQAAIQLIPEVIWLGGTVDQRYAAVERLRDAVTKAAAAAIEGHRLDLALEWLEQGRSIIWNQTLALRSPLDNLFASHPSMATRFQDIRDELQNLSLRISPTDILTSLDKSCTLEREVQRHHELAIQYADLISQIRQLHGFENFLRPRSVAELVYAARTGPVVVINIYEARCDALIIKPGCSVMNHVPLSNFTYEKAHTIRTWMDFSLGRGDVRERADRRPFWSEPDDKQDFREVLAILWEDVAKPVLNRLEFTVAASEKLPNITWCTTGPLSFLPLHAAGYYDRPHCKLSDYAISSYTPTLGALLIPPPAPEDHSSLIAIGQKTTPGFSDLPGTARELAYIQNHAQKLVRYNQIIDSDATPAVVLDQMEQHAWVHLACHAHQSIADPRTSGFFLHGGTLDLSAIAQKEFKNKGLAFLSACQTATGDKKLADEAVHLASGMLMAGYPSVIATMWAVGDSDAPFVANKVYERLLKDGKMNCKDAARALHYAVAELREEIGDDKFECWAPFIHLGL
ncbi:unnamed protein product [Rhizoctonia solani]|uniref:CHAT domain-containing protein n=1 Tax=Rhizoctonia solani TaxID=456999 RepID=A0A8H3H8M6_9AGAM|nr:unnamed protein product [Rhizoctonia solani]